MNTGTNTARICLSIPTSTYRKLLVAAKLYDVSVEEFILRESVSRAKQLINDIS